MSSPAQPFVRVRHFVFDFALCATVTLVGAVPPMYSGPQVVLVLLFALLITLPLMFRRMLPRIAFATMAVGGWRPTRPPWSAGHCRSRTKVPGCWTRC